MKAIALDDFGGGTFSKISDSFFGGDGPNRKDCRVSKKVPELMMIYQSISLVLLVVILKPEIEIERRKRITELEKDIVKFGR